VSSCEIRASLFSSFGVPVGTLASQNGCEFRLIARLQFEQHDSEAARPAAQQLLAPGVNLRYLDRHLIRVA
jgi:hypothetical protein